MRALFFVFALVCCSCLSATNYHEMYRSELDLEVVHECSYVNYPKCLTLVDLIKESADPEPYQYQLKVEVILILDWIDYRISMVEDDISYSESVGNYDLAERERLVLGDIYRVRSKTEEFLEYTK